jgi:hypothetical protein
MGSSNENTRGLFEEITFYFQSKPLHSICCANRLCLSSSLIIERYLGSVLNIFCFHMPLGYLNICINDFYFLRLPVQFMARMLVSTVDGIVINERECAWVCVLTL